MSVVNTISVWAVPVLLFFIPLYAFLRGVPLYDEFIAGAKEGLLLAWQLTPFLVAMLAAVRVFSECGALELIFSLLPTGHLGIPGEVLPLAFLRPLSGSGSLAFTADLLQTYGADSFTGRLASVMQGSTETTFYVLTVYFGAAGVKKARYALAVGLFGDLVAFLAAYYFTVLFFT